MSGMERYLAYNIVWANDEPGRKRIVEIPGHTCGGETTAELIAGALGFEARDSYHRFHYPESFDYRRLSDAAEIGVFTCTFGEVYRAYGGPEEGGWWYDHFTPLRVLRVPRKLRDRLLGKLERLIERHRVECPASDTRYAVQWGEVGNTPRPHYC